MKLITVVTNMIEKEWGLKILSEVELEGIYMIRTDVIIVAIHLKLKEIRILFHASYNPSDSAAMALEFSKIKGIGEIISSNIFVYSESKEDILVGDAANKNMLKEIENITIEKFMKKQWEIQFLAMSEGARC
jgi:hypothetical protein